jgi:Trk K+ transport system NAD-binding subunit
MYVIIGCGSVGYNVARMLRDRGKEVLILDRDKKRVEDLRDAELQAQQGDLDDPEPQRAALEQAAAALLMSSNMKGNLHAVRWLKREMPQV